MSVPLNPRPHSTHRIRFDDCDPFGHLNNISYQRYFLRAREDHVLDFYDFDLFRHMALNKTGWVVTSFQIRYLAPALMNELVVIESALVHYDAASLWVEAIMYDQKRERIKALAWMQFAYIDAQTGGAPNTTRPLPHCWRRCWYPNIRHRVLPLNNAARH